MSTKVSESLHELIKFLSKSEKRYFKVMSSRHTIGDENNYIKLFDYLELQDVYDEQAIFNHFKGETFLNKFSITKKRLYDHIVNALDAFHYNSSVDAQIYKLMHSADILYDKSLYEQSRRQLRSAERLAQKHDKYNLLLEISYKLKRLTESLSATNSLEIEDILENDALYEDRSSSYNRLWNLKGRLFALLASKGISRTNEDLIEFRKIIDDLLINTDKKKLHFDAQYLYNHIYSAYFFAIGSLEQCYTYLNENMNLLESKKYYISEHPNKYFSILTNMIFVATKLKKNKESQILLKKLKALNEEIEGNTNEDLKIKLFSSLNSIELTLHTLKGELDKAKKIIPAIEKGLHNYDSRLSANRRAFLNFKVATIYFIDGDMHNALKWINNILNDTKLDKQEDILSFSQIMNLLIHYEMKNDDLVNYSIRNTQRFLKSRNRLFEFESLFLKFLNKANKTVDKINKDQLFEELYMQIAGFKEDNLQNVAFDYFDFISWAEAKIKNQSFSDLIKLKFKS